MALNFLAATGGRKTRSITLAMGWSPQNITHVLSSTIGDGKMEWSQILLEINDISGKDAQMSSKIALLDMVSVVFTLLMNIYVKICMY